MYSYLENPLKDPPAQIQDDYFRLPSKFTEDEHHMDIGDALILHLRLAIEQQTRKGLNSRRLDENHKTEYTEIQVSVEGGWTDRYPYEGDQTVTDSSVFR